jgi:hypothetical protein
MIRSLLLLLLAAPIAAQPSTLPPPDPAPDPMTTLRALPPLEMDEVIWLARCLVTESNRPREQWYVAWVVRNRVETRFAGATYREVVLEPFQFSAFNKPSPARDAALALSHHSEAPHWREAVRIALLVTRADSSQRPFPASVRHFYSPISMQPAGSVPHWAQGRTPVALGDPTISSERFRFFDGLDAGSAPARLHPVAIQVDASPSGPSRVQRSSIRERRGLRTSITRPARPSGPSKPTRTSGG